MKHVMQKSVLLDRRIVETKDLEIGKFPNMLDNSQTAYRGTNKQSAKVPDGLEWFLDELEICQIAWKILNIMENS